MEICNMTQICSSFKDVVQFAIDKEEKAREFYSQCQNQAKSPGLKKFFQEMAEEEQRHKDQLTKLDLEGRLGDIPLEDTPDLSLSDFMIDVKFKPDLSYQEALVMAMKKEQKAHAFYEAWKNRCTDPKTSNIFNWLAEEELKHKHKLEDMYESDILDWQ